MKSICSLWHWDFCRTQWIHLQCTAIKNIPGWWLSPTPLKNMSSSVGMIYYQHMEKNVPNHQPNTYDIYCIYENAGYETNQFSGDEAYSRISEIPSHLSNSTAHLTDFITSELHWQSRSIIHLGKLY